METKIERQKHSIWSQFHMHAYLSTAQGEREHFVQIPRSSTYKPFHTIHLFRSTNVPRSLFFLSSNHNVSNSINICIKPYVLPILFASSPYLRTRLCMTNEFPFSFSFWFQFVTDNGPPNHIYN